MFSAAGVLVLLIAAAGILYRFAGAPGAFEDAPRDVLIFAAHSDDCVIVGSEYAHGSVACGRSVHIVYLTCSGPDAEAEISRTRRREALAAWSALGVPEDGLRFVDLSESAVAGPVRYSDEQLVEARGVFRAAILELSADAALIIPASGESHVDHRTVRRVALEALRESGRTDLIVYESPEYNTHLSLRCAPERTMREIVRQMPGLSRIIPPYSGPASFTDGPAGAAFRDPARLETKKELLMRFPSQDGKALVRFFGYPARYRVLDPSRADAGVEPEGGLAAFGHTCDLSALAWGVGVGVAVFLLAGAVVDRASHALSQPFVFEAMAMLVGTLGAVGYVVRALRHRVSRETALFACAAGLGMALGAI